MALALYRKYRPRTFAEVIGQEHVTEPLSQALRSGRLHHAYLFSGPRGCGKTSSARILARSLNCEQGPTPEPCGVCASCRSLANDGTGSIDVIEIDAASHGGVDDARELREKAFFAPAGSRYKIYVIDEAHMVSPAGFNALLKLVEEPPDYVKFIFATTEPEKVLGTIRSRTHHYPFRLIPPAVLRPYLQQLAEAEGIPVEPAVFPLVVKAGGGSARDTLSVLDQLIAGAGPDGVSYARAVALLGVTDVTLIDDMCDALAAGDGAAAYSTIDRVAEAGHDPRRFASDLLERLRDLIVLQQVPDAVTKGLIDGPADQLEAMAAQATRLGPATLSRCADIVHNGLVEMRGTTAPRLLLELITARMLLPGAEDSTGALLQRLERMERRLTLTADSGGGELAADQREPGSGVSAAGAGVGGGVVAAAAGAGGGGLSAARAAAAAASRRTSPGAGATPPGESGEAAAGSPGAGPEASGPRIDGPAVAGSGVTAQPAPAGRAGDFEPEYYDDEPPWDDEPELESGRAEPPRAAQPVAAPQQTPATPAPGPPSGSPAAARPVSLPATRAAATPGQTRRAEPAGVLPDAPEEPGAAAVNAGVPGRLDVTAIREVWPEIVTAIGHQSKKVSALASGATVRDLDGDTLVLTFRFPAHAKMVAPEAPLISNALYEALGGRWQIRCEVAGEGGAINTGASSGSAVQGGRAPSGNNAGPRNEPARGAGSPASAGAQPSSRPPAWAQPPAATQASDRATQSRRRTAEAPSSGGDDDWPEPARPGGISSTTPAVSAEDSADDDWPEVRPVGRPPGGLSAGDGSGTRSADERDAGSGVGGVAGVRDSSGAGQVGLGSAGSGSAGSGSAGFGSVGFGSAEAGSVGPGGSGSAGSIGIGSAEAGSVGPGGLGSAGSVGTGGFGAAGSVASGAGAATGLDLSEAGISGMAVGGAPVTAGSSSSAAVRTGVAPAGGPPADAGHQPSAAAGGLGGEGASVANAGSRNAGPGSGLAAARAAAAGARTAAARPVAKPATAPAWSDGSPTEEAPFDPELDGGSESGSAESGSAAFEGFDPGDEPLDDVIDEKTARESSEQQAMRLLQEAFGAEKIGES